MRKSAEGWLPVLPDCGKYITWENIAHRLMCMFGGSMSPRSPCPLTSCSLSFQIKVEEDFGFEADEALDSSWVSRGPDKLLPYPTLASPPFD